jgi:predicted nuclease of predicted toxin-antitoxin system
MSKPKFLLDADMVRSSADIVRSIGFDVSDVRDLGMRYAEDEKIITFALKTGRIIITRDLDFGSVIRYPNHPGAIILRLPLSTRLKS